MGESALSWRMPLASSSIRRTCSMQRSISGGVSPRACRRGCLALSTAAPAGPHPAACCPPGAQVCELAYSKATDWVLAVPEDSAVQCAADLAGALAGPHPPAPHARPAIRYRLQGRASAAPCPPAKAQHLIMWAMPQLRAPRLRLAVAVRRCTSLGST